MERKQWKGNKLLKKRKQKKKKEKSKLKEEEGERMKSEREYTNGNCKKQKEN